MAADPIVVQTACALLVLFQVVTADLHLRNKVAKNVFPLLGVVLMMQFIGKYATPLVYGAFFVYQVCWFGYVIRYMVRIWRARTAEDAQAKIEHIGFLSFLVSMVTGRDVATQPVAVSSTASDQKPSSQGD